MIAAVGARYSSNPKVVMFSANPSNAATEEWIVPHGTTVDGISPTGSTETSRWLAAGYTTQKIIDQGCPTTATTGIIDAAMAAFPNQVVMFAAGQDGTTLDPSGTNYAAQTVFSNAKAKYGNRIAVQKNNLSAKSPVAPGTNTYLQILSDNKPQVGAQMLWWVYGDNTYKMNGRVSGDPTTILKNAVDLAHGYGLKYLEIYQADITGLPSAIHYAHGLLTQSSPTPTPTPTATPIPTPYPPTNLHVMP